MEMNELMGKMNEEKRRFLDENYTREAIEVLKPISLSCSTRELVVFGYLRVVHRSLTVSFR